MFGIVTAKIVKLSDEEKMTLRRENASQDVQAFKALYGVAPDFMND